MTIPPVIPASARYLVPPLPVRRFTVVEYHQLARLDFFAADERYELLDGWIVPKLRRTPPHDSHLTHASTVISSRLPAGWRTRVGCGMTLSASEPEPDVVVVVGTSSRYRSVHPTPVDVAVVVEVADSSLDRDRAIKGPIYARDSLPIYWIVNLVDMLIEVYTDPTGPVATPGYQQCRQAHLTDTVDLILAGQVVATIPVADLLA